MRGWARQEAIAQGVKHATTRGAETRPTGDVSSYAPVPIADDGLDTPKLGVSSPAKAIEAPSSHQGVENADREKVHFASERVVDARKV